MTDEPATAGIAVSNIVYDDTHARGPRKSKWAPPLAFTVPWQGDVPVKGEDDGTVTAAIGTYARWLCGRDPISFEWTVEARP